MDPGLFPQMSPLLTSFILILLAGPAVLNPSASRELQVRTPRDAEKDSFKVVISEGCSSQGDSSDISQGGKEIDLVPGSPLVLTHKIKLVPSGSGSGSCGCDGDFAALRERLESLEREVSDLREKCGETGGSCCTSESKGAGCLIKPENGECPNECSDQGRCVDGKCVCFPGYTGPDCSESGCPGNCNDHGRCVNGECVCDSGFSGPDCTQKACPDNCNSHGRCVNGQCVCDTGFTGPSCSEESCPRNCNRRGRCTNGKCVCNAGFTGADCSKKACPGNCNNHGRCVNGKCVCDTGFAGPDCSKIICPENCNNKGRCVDGQCVCNEGFAGADCSEVACPGNCNNRGQCINGQCVCDDGFTGKDCLEKACLNDCNNRGRCVDGNCVCDSPFTGSDCNEITCPGNCNDRGQCVNGQCVCDDGFTGAECSERTCPNSCSNHGRCVDGQCVCESDFTGDDCSESACPENCNDRGRCIDGQCVCYEGFTGADCSEQACPNNCNNNGRCVDGECVCDVGFTGPDCAVIGCPNDCSNKGRCIKGRCACRRGFTGPDCSQCKDGMTGPNCNTAMSGVPQLNVEDITESSATLIWTHPSVQYETYYITFTSLKETDQQITKQLDGSLTTFTQTGLAAGQKYIVSIVGEINGRRGAESSTSFMTLISGPTNLQVVKTTSTSAVVQWEQSQGEIDRYRLTITPNDGIGRTQEMTVEAGKSSAHIQQLEAGRVYNVLLEAEKDAVRSKPATTEVVPGNIFPMAAIEDLTVQVTRAPGQDVGSISGDYSISVNAKTRPLVNTKSRNGTRPQIRRPTFPKPGLSRPNATRIMSGTRHVVPGTLLKNPMPLKIQELLKINKTKPDVQIIGDPVPDHSKEESSSKKSDSKGAVVISGHNFAPTGESSSEEQSYTDSNIQPDAGITEAENENHSDTSAQTKNFPNQDKKCMNKIKVTNIRLPFKNRNKGCREDAIGLAGSALSSLEESPSSEEDDVDYTPDPLHKLIAETFDKLNITTISVHLAKPLNLSTDADIVSRQILKGMKPLPPLLASSSFTAKSSYLSARKPSSPAAEPPSSLTDTVSSSLSSLPSPSSTKPSLSRSSVSSSATSLEDLDQHGNNELDFTTNSAPTVKSEIPSSEESSITAFHNTYPKKGFIRRPYPNLLRPRNKTHHHLRVPVNSPLNLGNTPIKETKDVSSSPSFSISNKSPALEADTPGKDRNIEGDRTNPNATSGIEESKKKMLIERRLNPLRRPTFKGTYQRRLHPNLQNRTRPVSQLLTTHSKSLNPNTDTPKEQMFPIELEQNSTHVSEDSLPTKTVSANQGSEGTGTRIPHTDISNGFHRIVKERVLPFSRQPNILKQHQHGESAQNKTFMNLRQRQHPKGTMRRPFLGRKQNGGSHAVGHQSNVPGKYSSVGNPESQPETQNTQRSNSGFQTNQSGEQMNGMLGKNSRTHEKKTTANEQIEDLNKEDNTLIQLEAAANSNIKQRDDTGRDIGPTDKSKTVSKPLRRITLPKRQPIDTADMGHQHGTHRIAGKQEKELAKTNPTAKTVFDTENEWTEGSASEVSSSVDKREPLDYVGVKNQTSDGFTVVWDSPEGKYKNFVLSRTVVERDEKPKQKEDKQEEDEDQISKELSSENGSNKDNNKVPEDVRVPNIQRGAVNKPADEDKVFKQVLPGSARSLQFDHLPPQTEYTITLLGKGPGILSKLHKLVISTGPEPPSNIVFSKVTENSLTVSWTKPKSNVNGFKVTYTNADEGEPVSVTVDSQDSSLDLSQLAPGSSYEVTIISTLGLDESDPIKDTVMTLPDPPTNLQAVNVNDTTALLLWRPALATVDKYTIVYGSGSGSELRLTVSGNAAEQQLSGLEGSTTYTVTVTSQLGSLESSPATTSFTTKSSSRSDNDGANDLKASDVTPRSAVMSWIPSSKPVEKYVLLYGREGEDRKEMIVSPDQRQYKLTRLHPGSLYKVELQSIRGGQLIGSSYTDFTTGTLLFPYPTDCSQELQNGVFTSDVVEIFPQGELGQSMNVYCDMETDGGGWTVFQRRKDGSVNFYNGWRDYVSGFGNLSGEFWLGLDNIHNLTKMTRMNLRVDLRDGDEQVFAKYTKFSVAKRNYKLSVGGYSGTAGDSLSYHDNCVFSTKDRDPAPWITRCAISYQGGWWYKNCHEANLNGLYGIDFKHQGVIWKSWKGEDHSIQFTEMKMRPASFISTVSRAK
ncbi:PREDICTED: tenascin-like isoform X1 [Cyprinodon variegatus]|uniref:Tenascin-like n=1 Tax=Cyprinodon variegatus TaxID=28743 RepID=A0A3Q2E9B0_CYPVA|nr:PREDICTED: tenascin-like isoform X1 [Cyprinodon variegatus]